MPYKMQKLEEGIRAAVSFIDAINKQDSVLLESLLDDFCILETCYKDEIYKGYNAVKNYYESFFLQYPDQIITVKEIHNMGKKILFYCMIESEEDHYVQTACMIYIEVQKGKLIYINLFSKK